MIGKLLFLKKPEVFMSWNWFICAIFLFGDFTTLAAYSHADCFSQDDNFPENTRFSAIKEIDEPGFIAKDLRVTVYQEKAGNPVDNFQIGIFEQPPENFDHTIQVSACVVQVGNRILSLQRGIHKKDPGKWEVPGGKFLEGETLNDCASRELFEETGIEQNIFLELGILYVRRIEGDFTLHVIFTELPNSPNVEISKEHNSYRWVTADEMRNLDLIKGEELLIDLYLKTVGLENN